MGDCDCNGCTKFHVTDMFKLNGAKTYLGLAVLAAGFVLEYVGGYYTLSEQLIDAGTIIAGVGAAHKAQKIFTALRG